MKFLVNALGVIQTSAKLGKRKSFSFLFCSTLSYYPLPMANCQTVQVCFKHLTEFNPSERHQIRNWPLKAIKPLLWRNLHTPCLMDIQIMRRLLPSTSRVKQTKQNKNKKRVQFSRCGSAWNQKSSRRFTEKPIDRVKSDRIKRRGRQRRRRRPHNTLGPSTNGREKNILPI